jgi:hypothetical protein
MLTAKGMVMVASANRIFQCQFLETKSDQILFLVFPRRSQAVPSILIATCF